MAFTATSVLLVLLLVILARMFQTKFKTHFPTRCAAGGCLGGSERLVVEVLRACRRVRWVGGARGVGFRARLHGRRLLLTYQ